MAKPPYIELDDGKETHRLPILFEDRSLIAIDKPATWMLVPFSWQSTGRNLQAAITSSIAADDFWAKSRNLNFLRFVHRLDADTTGILLLAKSMGAVDSYGELFESRQMEKTYLAVVDGIPKQKEWTCELKLGQVPGEPGRMRVDAQNGKDAETHFKVLEQREGRALVEAYPHTGRTHQIRVHLASAGTPVAGDKLYGKEMVHPAMRRAQKYPLALRAATLSFKDPFTRRPVRIQAPTEEFLQAFGFGKTPASPAPATPIVPAPKSPVPPVKASAPVRPAPSVKPAPAKPYPRRRHD